MSQRLARGALVVFEGIDGAGKTTQAQTLVDSLRAEGFEALYSKEPTEGPWGLRIRQSAQSERLAPQDELQAFLEDRREHVQQLIKPALASGVVVVLDRYYYSNAAYQGARGADAAAIIAANEEFAPRPDLLILLDVPVDVGLQRVHARGLGVSAFERAEALEMSARLFRALDLPFLLRLDGQRRAEDLSAEILGRVQRLIRPA